MKNLLALTILGLTGCGGLEFQVNSSNVAIEFVPYVQQFIFEGQSRGIALNYNALNKISIQFDSKVAGSTLARCEVSPGHLDIVVGPVAWLAASKASRELLINHEMGHCILGKMAHDDTIITFHNYYNELDTWQGPESIMNTYALPDWLYVSNREYYLNQLFGSYINLNQELYYNSPSQFNASNY